MSLQNNRTQGVQGPQRTQGDSPIKTHLPKTWGSGTEQDSFLAREAILPTDRATSPSRITLVALPFLVRRLFGDALRYGNVTKLTLTSSRNVLNTTSKPLVPSPALALSLKGSSPALQSHHF